MKKEIKKSEECGKRSTSGRPHGGAPTEDINIKDKVYAIIVRGGVLDAP